MKSKLLVIVAPIMALAIVANAHAQLEERPTEYSSGCAYAYNYPSYAYDNNFSTASSLLVAQGNKGGEVGCETWFGFASAPSGATGLQLNINSSASVFGSKGGSGSAYLSYSLDGGETFTYVYFLVGESGSIGTQTNVVSLSDTQDLTKVQVKGYISEVSVGFGASATQSLYEIWISYSD